MPWFRRKSKTAPPKQRQIFIAREIDPLWFLDKYSTNEDKVSKSAEDWQIYLTNNIGLQVPVGKVFLVNMGTESAQMTMGSIQRKLAGYDLVEWRSDNFPSTSRTKLRNWLKQVTHEVSNEPEGCLIFVVDRSTFELWLEQIDTRGEATETTCLLRRESSGEILIAA